MFSTTYTSAKIGRQSPTKNQGDRRLPTAKSSKCSSICFRKRSPKFSNPEIQRIPQSLIQITNTRLISQDAPKRPEGNPPAQDRERTPRKRTSPWRLSGSSVTNPDRRLRKGGNQKMAESSTQEPRARTTRHLRETARRIPASPPRPPPPPAAELARTRSGTSTRTSSGFPIYRGIGSRLPKRMGGEQCEQL